MKNILLVEDVDDYRMDVCYALGRRGFTVFEAASATEALRYAEHIPTVDLALLNIQLPDTNGLELAALLKKRYGDAMQVLYLSAPVKPEMELLRADAAVSHIVSCVFRRFPDLETSRAAHARG